MLPVDSSVVNFGNAAFESLRLYERRSGGPVVLGLDAHWRRLATTLRALRVPAPEVAELNDAVARVAALNGLGNAYLRVLVFPAGDASKLDVSGRKPVVAVSAWKLNSPRHLSAIRLKVASRRRPAPGSGLTQAKYTGAYAADGAEHTSARLLGFDDALVLTAEGLVCEITGGNLFLVHGGRLLTPRLPVGIIGVTREMVRDIARARGHELREVDVTLTALAAAEEVFVTGTFHGIRPVSAIDDHEIAGAQAPRITQELQDAFDDLLDHADTGVGSKWFTEVPTADLRAARQRSYEHTIRPATPQDVPFLVESCTELLRELRRDPTVVLPPSASESCHRILEGKAKGIFFVAEPGDGGRPIGMLSLTLQEAVHLGGEYALIQDLWVRPELRSEGIGRALIEAAHAFVIEHRLHGLEVCLPRRSFPGFARTYAFYASSGFSEIGPRMRLTRPTHS